MFSVPLGKMSDFVLTLNGVRGCTKEINEARPHEKNEKVDEKDDKKIEMITNTTDN